MGTWPIPVSTSTRRSSTRWSGARPAVGAPTAPSGGWSGSARGGWPGRCRRAGAQSRGTGWYGPTGRWPSRCGYVNWSCSPPRACPCGTDASIWPPSAGRDRVLATPVPPVPEASAPRASIVGWGSGGGRGGRATGWGGPGYRLVQTEPAPIVLPRLDPTQQAVVDHPGGPLLVLAGPGTGKTTTVVEAVAVRIDAGNDPEQILVLTFSRKAAAELRTRITSRVPRTIREPLARTFHSYAFGVL